MFTRLISFSTAIALALVLSACETSPPAKPDVGNQPESAAKTVDVQALVTQVVELRDRTFSGEPPTFEEVPKMDGAAIAGHADYVTDRRVLQKVLFGHESAGELTAVDDHAIATFDAQTNTIRYVPQADPVDLERALVYAIVDAIDHGHFAAQQPAKTWDAELARATAAKATGSFVYAALLAQKKGVDERTVARRPEAMAVNDEIARAFAVGARAKAEDMEAAESAFVRREGFTLSAALFRSGGWSAAELVRIDPPESSAWVVRPDRWLAGDDLGTWNWPATVDKTRAEKGWTTQQSGRIGPAIAAMWLGQFIDPRIARSLYISWSSDSFRYYDRKGAWAFEWVSLWNTPADAEQVAQAFDRGFREAKHGNFVVLKQGATVAVIGTSVADQEQPNTLVATELLTVGPQFLPKTPQMVGFVPTPFDVYTQDVAKAQLVLDPQMERWADPASKLSMSLEPLETWNVQKTESATARWVANKKDGASVLMNTELFDPFAPAFGSDDYRKRVVANFKATMTEPKVLIEETVKPDQLGTAHHLRIEGKVDNLPAVIELWMFKVDDVVVTLSLKAWPDTVEQARPAFAALVEGVSIKQTGRPETADAGIIEFKVENQ